MAIFQFLLKTADTLYGPVHSEMAVDIYKRAVDDAQKQVCLYLLSSLDIYLRCFGVQYHRVFLWVVQYFYEPVAIGQVKIQTELIILFF